MGGKRKVQDWYHIKKLSSTDPVSARFWFGLCHLYIIPEGCSDRRRVGEQQGCASCAGHFLASRKHSDLREMLQRSPKRGASLRAHCESVQHRSAWQSAFFGKPGLGSGREGRWRDAGMAELGTRQLPVSWREKILGNAPWGCTAAGNPFLCRDSPKWGCSLGGCDQG